MLGICKYVVGVKVFHNGACNDVFKCLTCYGSKRDRSVVLCFTAVALLENWYHVGCFPVVTSLLFNAVLGGRDRYVYEDYLLCQLVKGIVNKSLEYCFKRC
jgi:hypothetical protein